MDSSSGGSRSSSSFSGSRSPGPRSRSRSRSRSRERASDALTAVEDFWSFYSSEDVQRVAAEAIDAFGNPRSTRDLDEAEIHRISEINVASSRFLDDPEVAVRVRKLFLIVARCREVVAKIMQMRTPLEVEFVSEENIKTASQKRTYLVDRAYEYCMREDLRLFDSKLYTRHVTPSGTPTCYWVEKTEVKRFVYEKFGRMKDPLSYSFYTGLGGEALGLHTHVSNSLDDPRLPVLKQNRHVFSFDNGVYITKVTPDIVPDAGGSASGLRHLFLPYLRDRMPGLNREVAAARHFDSPFDVDAYDAASTSNDPEAWATVVRTPVLDSVLDRQDIKGQAYLWVMFLIGRMLYDADGLQIVPFVLGRAGTGKSTLLQDVVGKFYDADKIGIVDNTIEKTFGLWPLADKFLFYCSEVRNNFEIPQATFQKMVAGEDIQIAVKFEKARRVRWTVPGILAGNEMFGYKDASGSIMRRVVIVHFKNHVSQCDTGLPAKLHDELPNILLKANMAYHWGTKELAGRDFWSLRVPYFVETSKILAASVDPLRKLLEDEDNDEIVIAHKNPKVYCTLTTIVNRLRAPPYCHAMDSALVKQHRIFQEGNFGISTSLPGLRLPYPRLSHSHERAGVFVFGFDVRNDNAIASEESRMDEETEARIRAHFGW